MTHNKKIILWYKRETRLPEEEEMCSVAEKYDENLQENSFFKTLCGKYEDLWRDAVKRKLWILVPQSDSIKKLKLNDSDIFRRHIIDADPEKEGVFYNLNGEEVSCCEQLLTLSPSSTEQENSSSGFQTAKVLFEETFFTESDRSYRLLCISQPLTLLQEQDYRQHDFDDSSVTVSTPLADSEIENMEPFSVEEDEEVESEKSQFKSDSGQNDRTGHTENDCLSSRPGSSSFQTGSLFSAASFSAIGDEDTDYCMRVLFSNETNYRFESYLQRGCCLFAQKLVAKYQRSWNVKTVLDIVAAEFHSNLRLVLKRRRRQSGSKLHSREVDCVKLATEIYFFHCVGRTVLSVLRGCLSEEESELNRERHVAEKLSPQDFGVNPALFESIPAARKVLARLTKPMSPHSRLLCLRRTIMALNVQGTNATKSDGVRHRLLSSDDLLPALVYLVLKSTSVTDWTSNLVYMSDFHFSKASGDELGYCLASFEAAAQYIRNKSLRKIAVSAQLPKRNLSAMDLIISRSLNQDEVIVGSSAATEEVGSLKEYVMALIETGDEVGLSEFYQQQEAVNRFLNSRDVTLLLCHPLCDCESCELKRADTPEYSGENMVLDVNSPLFEGKTGLHVAALLSKSSILGTLCKNGAIVDLVDDENMTALHLACRVGCQSSVMLLLHLGARIDICDRDGNSPLHTAAYYGFVDCVKALLYFDQHIRGSKMKVNLVNDSGDTALHLAVKYQHIEIAAVLLECGAVAKIRNKQGKTTADLCDNALLQYLLLKEDPGLDFILVEKRGAVGSTLSVAEMASILSDETDEYQSVKSHPSAESEDDESNYYLSSCGTHLNLDRSTSENLAISKVDRLLRAVADNDLQMVMKYFIGCEDAESKEKSDNSGKLCHPLCQCEKCLKILESREDMVDVDALGSSGRAAIHVASEKGHFDIVKYLVKLGADVNLLDRVNKESPVHIAAKESRIKILEFLFRDCGASLQILDGNGDTPLHVAARKGLMKVVQKLCELDADVHAANAIGDTPLHQAVKWDRWAIIEDLLGYGASVYACNNMRLTPLDLARSQDTRALLNKYAQR